MALRSPRIDAVIKQIGSLPSQALNGVGMLQIPTKRGEHGRTVFVSSENAFLREFGGHYDIGVSDYASYALLMLRQGIPLYISRIGHYTDPSDKTTLVGTKASGQIANATTTAAIGGVNQGTKTFTVLATDLTAFFVEGVKFTVTGSTGNDGTYTVVSSTLNVADTDVIVLEAIPDATVDGSINYSTEALVVCAGFVGDGYNGSVVTVSDAASGNASNCDISVSLTDSPDSSDFVFSDVPRGATLAELASFSALFAQLDLVSVGGQIPNGSTPLSGGVEDITLIDANDYAGDQTEGTGVYAFDSIDDAFRLVNFVPLPAIDSAYKTYAEARKDIRVSLGAPIANISGVKAYLAGTSPYSHAPINSLYVSQAVGDAWILDPRDLNKQLNIPAILPAAISALKKDGSGNYWFSAAQEDYKRSGLQFVRMGLDLGSAANQSDYDEVYRLGGNAISKKAGEIVYFGNRTTQSDLTKLSRAENIADLLVYVKREFGTLFSELHFQPNDPIFWRSVYRKARKWIVDTLEAGRAIYAGEGTNWAWIGDQDADFLQDASFNSQADLLAGKYKAQFRFIPIAAAEDITLEIVATTEGVSVEI